MRYLGTLMLLASVAMLLFPSFWEGRGALTPARAAGRQHRPLDAARG